MKHFLCILSIILAFWAVEATAQSFDSRIRLTFENELATDNLIVIGADSDATDSLDKPLGELYLAPFPPPAPDLFVVSNWDTNDLSGKWTYTDLRSVPGDQIEFYHRYRIILFKRVDSRVKITWTSIPGSIKSAVISDKLGGILFSADMKTADSVIFDNKFLDRLEINVDVWFDKNGVSVIDDDTDDYAIYPNPASDYIRIKNSENINQISIYNVLGDKVGEYDSATAQDILNISNLTEGNYILKIMKTDNTFTTRSIIKIKN